MKNQAGLRLIRKCPRTQIEPHKERNFKSEIAIHSIHNKAKVMIIDWTIRFEAAVENNQKYNQKNILIYTLPVKRSSAKATKIFQYMIYGIAHMA